MKSTFYHLQFNVDFSANFSFYKDLMKHLEWEVVFEGENMAGYKSVNNVDVWFIDSKSKDKQNYDHIGANHFSIKVEKQSDVDELIKFLEEQSIETLFGTPKHRSDFASSEKDTYYQIMFETPDRILFEIVYVGPK